MAVSEFQVLLETYVTAITLCLHTFPCLPSRLAIELHKGYYVELHKPYILQLKILGFRAAFPPMTWTHQLYYVFASWFLCSWYSDRTEPWVADILCSRFNLTAMCCFAGLYCVLGKEQVEKRVPWTPIGENKGAEIVRCLGVWIHKEQIPLMHSRNAAVLFIRILLLVCGKHFRFGVGSVFAHMSCWTELFCGIYRSLTPSECLRLPSLVILHLISSWTRPIKMSWNLNSLSWKLVLPSPMQQ